MTVPVKQPQHGEALEAVIANNDLAKLTVAQRNDYYVQVCKSIGLNPLTQPFAYITLNGKLALYAKRDCADQLRKINGISVSIVSQDHSDGLLTVHVRAKDAGGREDEDLGVVNFPDTLRGEARANAILKAVTKAKRRVTLSISGLGFLDETEVEDIPAAAKKPAPPAPNVMIEPPHDQETGEVVERAQVAADQPAPAVSEKPAGAGEGSEAIAKSDAALAEAAKKGSAALLAEWNKIPKDHRKTLKTALDQRHKPIAAEVEAQHAAGHIPLSWSGRA